MKSDNTVLQDFDKSVQEAEAKQKEVEAKAEEQKEQEPEVEVAKSEDKEDVAKPEDKESDKDKSKDKKSDKEEDSKEDKPKDDAKEDKESDGGKKDKEPEDKKEPEVKKSVEPKEDVKKDDDEELEESEDKEDEAKSEKCDEPEGEVKKDADESGDGAASPKPFEHDSKVGEINNPANESDFSAFNKTLTSGMSTIAKSFDLSQKQNAQANERLDHLSSELSELKGMLIDYMSTEKSLKDSEAVADEEPKEAEPVTDDEDVYVAEKSAAVSAPVEEDKAKDTEEVEKSLSFGDLREKALGLRSAYVDKFQKAADFGRISREDFLVKSENVNKLANGRLSEQELKDFIEYVEK